MAFHAKWLAKQNAEWHSTLLNHFHVTSLSSYIWGARHWHGHHFGSFFRSIPLPASRVAPKGLSCRPRMAAMSTAPQVDDSMVQAAKQYNFTLTKPYKDTLPKICFWGLPNSVPSSATWFLASQVKEAYATLGLSSAAPFPEVSKANKVGCAELWGVIAK